jgi:hypothetical protein
MIAYSAVCTSESAISRATPMIASGSAGSNAMKAISRS